MEQVRPKILILAHRVPYPPDKGDRIRSYHLLRYLASRGSVHLGYLTDEGDCHQTTEALEGLCEYVFTGQIGRWQRCAQGSTSLLAGKSITEGWFYSAPFQREVDRLISTHRYDAVTCMSSSTLQYVRRHALEDRLVCDLVDVDSEKWLDYSRQGRAPMSWLFRIEGDRVRRIERQAADSCAVVLSTEREAACYRELFPHAAVQAVKNGIDLDYFTPRENEERQGCIFVGYLDYRANVLGLEWFCKEIWPALVQRQSGATFKVVGRNPTRAVNRLQQVPGVEVVGPVPDIRPLIAETSVVVVPLPIARGIQNKILEAMAMRKAVVTSQAASKGVAARSGREIVHATSPQEWIEAISNLWNDTTKRREIGRQARLFVESHHHWDHCLAPIGRICDRIQGRHSAGRRILDEVAH